MKKKHAGIWFVLPGFAGVLVFYLLPFVDVLRRSVMTAVGNQFCGLKNFNTVLENDAFLQASSNTAKFLAVCLPLLLFLSFVVALFLLEAGHLALFFKSAYLVPLAVPAASVVFLWRLIFDAHGLLNSLLDVLGREGADWMNTDAAFGVLVFSYIWKNLGYVVVLWLAGLTSVPETVYEAARVDGAGKWNCLLRITLPCIRPIIFTIVVISLLNSFKVFREAWLVVGNYPQDSMYLLQHLFNNWFRDLSIDKMSAGAVLLSVVIFLLVFLMQKGWEKEL